MNKLNRLASLIAQRNQMETEVSKLVGHPLVREHLGAYVAAEVFDIEPQAGEGESLWTGRFREGPLAGRTVAVQWIPRWDGTLSLDEGTPAEHLLVLAGPESLLRRDPGSPWVIESVYRFHLPSLRGRMRDLRHPMGPRTHVPREDWEAARLHPQAPGERRLTEAQGAALALFAPEETLQAC